MSATTRPWPPVSGTSAAPGTALWGEPLGPHSLENVGNSLLHIISIEIKPA